VVSGHRLKFSDFIFFGFLVFVFLVVFYFWLGGVVVCFLVLIIFFIFWYPKVILRGNFSTIHKEKNGLKAINSIQRWIIFLLRILTRGRISTQKNIPVNSLRWSLFVFTPAPTFHRGIRTLDVWRSLRSRSNHCATWATKSKLILH
jgi:Ca2+/Na+ antiporter